MPLIKHKRSLIPSKIPTISDLGVGEIGINVYDGRMWIKSIKASLQTIVEVITQNGGTLTGFLTLHAAPTANMHAATILS